VSGFGLLLACAVPGGAPTRAGGTTGYQHLLTPWTVFGGPLVSLPWGVDADGLPLSVMLAGAPGTDALVLAAAATGARIETVEGLGPNGELTDVQRSMIESGAVQCGFCTPGLVVAIHHLLETVPEPDDLTIREALSGNICRCTGYGRIIESVQRVAAVRRRGDHS
jgi:hypothetical protein